MKKIFLFLAKGFEEIEAIATIDVLRRAELEVITVSITNEKEVEGAHGVVVLADQLFDETDFTDNAILVTPGGLGGMQNLKAHEGLAQLLKKQNENQNRIASICASPVILGELGLLAGKEATAYPGFENDLIDATISPKSVVTDGNITTAQGPAFTIDFALQIVELLKGKETASEVAAGMLYKNRL